MSCRRHIGTPSIWLSGRPGIHTGLHYPVPIHLQPCYTDLGGQPGDFPYAEAAARTCISLPIYPELPEEAPAKVAEVIRHTLRLS